MSLLKLIAAKTAEQMHHPLESLSDWLVWAMLGQSAPDWTMLGVSFSAVLVLFVVGLYYFGGVERTFADIILMAARRRLSVASGSRPRPLLWRPETVRIEGSLTTWSN